MGNVKETVEGKEEEEGEAEVRGGEKGLGAMLVERREVHLGSGRSCRSWAAAGQPGGRALRVKGRPPGWAVTRGCRDWWREVGA